MKVLIIVSIQHENKIIIILFGKFRQLINYFIIEQLIIIYFSIWATKISMLEHLQIIVILVGLVTINWFP